MNLANGLTGSTDLEDNVSCDATAVLLKKGAYLQTHLGPSVSLSNPSPFFRDLALPKL